MNFKDRSYSEWEKHRRINEIFTTDWLKRKDGVLDQHLNSNKSTKGIYLKKITNVIYLTTSQLVDKFQFWKSPVLVLDNN